MTGFRPWLSAAIVAAAMSPGLQSTAAAQAQPPVVTPILVIDQEALYSRSAAARGIAEQDKSLREALTGELDADGERLRAREAELTELRETLLKSEFDALAREFETDVREFRARAQRERGLLDQALQNARRELRRAAQPVLIDVMRRRGALVLLDKGQVVLSVRTLDVTDEAIALLDQAVPVIEVNAPQTANPPP